MSTVAALSPRREFVLPALVIAAPLLYFTYRDASIAAGTGEGVGIRHLVFLVGALLVGYAAGVAFLAAADVARMVETSAIARAAFRPDDITLALLAVFVLGAGTYLLATIWIDVPSGVDTVLAPAGIVLGFPLIATQAATYALGNALGREPATWIQFVAVGSGVALSAVWSFIVATGLAGLVDVF